MGINLFKLQDDCENLITPEMKEAGADRLGDIGEASVNYLAVEAFVAMAAMACRQETPLGDALRREIQRLRTPLLVDGEIRMMQNPEVIS